MAEETAQLKLLTIGDSGKSDHKIDYVLQDLLDLMYLICALLQVLGKLGYC